MTAGLIIPLYGADFANWDAVIAAKKSHPSVPIIVIIDPYDVAGGFLSALDPVYVNWVNKFHAVGIKVIGYNDTNYATNLIDDVKAVVDIYYTWYKVDGIFFDQLQNLPGYESYYTDLNNYVHVKGGITVGNAGTNVPLSFDGSMDNIVIFEGGGLPSITLLTNRTKGFTKSTLSYVCYGVTVASFNLTNVINTSPLVSYLYVTTSNLYNKIQPYMITLISVLDTNVKPTITSVVVNRSDATSVTTT